MPIFEFRCEACGAEFEELLAAAEPHSPVRCPHCQGRRVSRKLSTFAARSGATKAASSAPAGACQRCGDPAGPCWL